MRLTRLKLTNWRGIGSREVALGDGVTIIEGPNEIGKSSTIEALRMLIETLDSSGKQEVKAVQPAGRDVGSSVEADIEAGAYRFTYGKTYNREKATHLEVHAPVREQLTGRDAHNRVTAMLAETVDLDLWRALLVDQGEKVGLADLRGSTSLVAALDEAAGTGQSSDEDHSLFDAVQKEYERYFTLKTGRSQFSADEKRNERAQRNLEAADSALREVETDVHRHQLLAEDLTRRQRTLPELEQSAAQAAQRWQNVQKMRESVERQRHEVAEREAAEARDSQALKARQALVKQIEDAKADIENAQTRLAPAKARRTADQPGHAASSDSGAENRTGGISGVAPFVSRRPAASARSRRRRGPSQSHRIDHLARWVHC